MANVVIYIFKIGPCDALFVIIPHITNSQHFLYFFKNSSEHFSWLLSNLCHPFYMHTHTRRTVTDDELISAAKKRPGSASGATTPSSAGHCG